MFLYFCLALENMTFNADGKFNLIIDLSNACCWISEISGQTKHDTKTEEILLLALQQNGMDATTTSINMISY
jgi:hypothetical protein